MGRHCILPNRIGDQVMALTLYMEQRLEAAELIGFFDDNREV